MKNRQNLKGGKYIVEDDVWIDAGAVILHKVKIGRTAVIGAGALRKMFHSTHLFHSTHQLQAI